MTPQPSKDELKASEEVRRLCEEVDPEEVVALTMEMVALWTPPGEERPMVDLITQKFAEYGIEDVTVDEEFEGSPSVIARLRGTEPGRTLQWHAHTDAINIAHSPVSREGDVISGRGTCDMKGGLAAMMQAAKLLKQAGLPRSGEVLITFHGLHEEGHSEPLHRLIERGVIGDAAISSELASGRDLITGSRGLTFWEFEVEGSPEVWHETNAPEGLVNPVAAGNTLVSRLLGHGAKLADGTAGPAGSLFVGSFVSGDYNNRFATSALISGTRRHHADAGLADVDAELRQIAGEVAAETGAVITPRIHGLIEAYDIDPKEPVAVALRRAVEEVLGEPMVDVKSRASGNAGDFVVRAGVPAVYYGCDYSTAHSDHEVASVAELARLVKIYALMAAYYLEDEGAAVEDEEEAG